MPRGAPEDPVTQLAMDGHRLERNTRRTRSPHSRARNMDRNTEGQGFSHGSSVDDIVGVRPKYHTEWTLPNETDFLDERLTRHGGKNTMYWN